MMNDRAANGFWDVPHPVGEEIFLGEFGPSTLSDNVRWAGVQENPARLHWDYRYVSQSTQLPTVIASGQLRVSLLMRGLTDLVGPRGVVNSLTVRQVGPTFEGDYMRFFATVTALSGEPEVEAIDCSVEGRNRDEQILLHGNCRFRYTFNERK